MPSSAEYNRMCVRDTEYLTEDDIVRNCEHDPQFAFETLVQVHDRQTEDEKASIEAPKSGGTVHKNRYGFSKKHVTRGSELAVGFLAGKDMSHQDIRDATEIATFYRKQAREIALGAVPLNMITRR